MYIRGVMEVLSFSRRAFQIDANKTSPPRDPTGVCYCYNRLYKFSNFSTTLVTFLVHQGSSNTNLRRTIYKLLSLLLSVYGLWTLPCTIFKNRCTTWENPWKNIFNQWDILGTTHHNHCSTWKNPGSVIFFVFLKPS